MIEEKTKLKDFSMEINQLILNNFAPDSISSDQFLDSLLQTSKFTNLHEKSYSLVLLMNQQLELIRMLTDVMQFLHRQF